MAVAKFSIAIDRPVKPGGEKQVDYPNVIVFGKLAENCERFLDKGRLVGIEGQIQTGSYTNRAGNKVYTTDVVASRIEFLEWGDKENKSTQSAKGNSTNGNIPDGFQAVDAEDIPF